MATFSQIVILVFIILITTPTVAPDPIPGPHRVGCREKTQPGNWDEQTNGNFRTLCRQAISTYGRGRPYSQNPICTEIKSSGCCRDQQVLNNNHNCCEWGNNVLDADKRMQQTKFVHIAAYLAYTQQNANELQLLIDKTIMKYTADKRLYALKIDETKLANLQPDHSQLFQTEGARTSKRKLGFGKKDQKEITTADIVRTINNDHSTDATNGRRIDSRVKVTNHLKEKDQPFSRIGMVLTVLYDDTTSVCTGTLIADKIVMLATHCLISNGIILSPGDLKFYPQRSKALGAEYRNAYPPDTSYTAVAIYFSYGYYRLDNSNPGDRPGKADWDIALIELSSSLKKDYGYLAYGVPDDDKIEASHDSINIGYPSSKGKGFMFKGFVFAAGNVPREIDNNEGFFDHYSEVNDQITATEIFPLKIVDNKYANSQGQSGSCVFYWDTTTDHKQYVAFAVVSAGKNRGEFENNFYRTYFTRITYEKGMQIQDIINVGVENYVNKIHTDAVELGVNAPNARVSHENQFDSDLFDVYDYDKSISYYGLGEIDDILLYQLLIIDVFIVIAIIGMILFCVGIGIFCGIYFMEDIKGFMFNTER